MSEAEIVESEDRLPSVVPGQTASIEVMTESQKADVGHALEQEIIDDSRQVMARYLRIGRNLHMVSQNQLYKQLGYETFEQWRAQPEMSLSRATSYALMKVFQVFIERLKVRADQLEGVDYTKLYNISQFVTPENVDEFLDKVKSLSRADLQREISLMRAKAGGKTDSQAEESVATLDIVREACPINCGSVCKLIDGDNDKAVQSFKKFLGKYRSLHARIQGLFGTDLGSTAKRKHASKSDEALPAQPDPAPAPVVGEPSSLPQHPQEQVQRAEIHGSDFEAGGEVLEGERSASGEKSNGRIWPD